MQGIIINFDCGIYPALSSEGVKNQNFLLQLYNNPYN